MAVRAAIYLGVPLAVLAGWFLLAASGTVNPFLLPAPDDVAGKFQSVLTDSRTYPHLWTTVRQIFTAFLLAAVVGIGIGLPIGWYQVLRRAYEPVLATVYAVPLVVLYPVIALLFGIGATSKIVFGALYAFFPVVLGTISAVSLVDRNLVAAGRSMGARGLTLFRTVVLPAAAPRIMAGLRLGVILATLAVVGGQYIAGTSGLGYLLATAGQSFQTVQMFAYILLTLALAALINGLMAALDHYTNRSFR
jgi:ABC-type nitrate/sulfonate/bicarbonate transport system permease component